MQYYYGLEWVFKERSDTVDYIDMRISIRKDWIVTLLYLKVMNLYLYTPPHFAHTPGVLTGLVSGNILCIHSLCSDKEGINRCMKEFYVRLIVRGYQRYLLIPEFGKGITGARAFIKRGSVLLCTSDQDKDTKGRLFFHLTYYPRDPTSKDLQRQCRQHLLRTMWGPSLLREKKHKIPIGINSMCVAYSRPKNLGNIFTYRKVDSFDGPPVSSNME